MCLVMLVRLFKIAMRGRPVRRSSSISVRSFSLMRLEPSTTRMMLAPSATGRSSAQSWLNSGSSPWAARKAAARLRCSEWALNHSRMSLGFWKPGVSIKTMTVRPSMITGYSSEVVVVPARLSIAMRSFSVNVATTDDLPALGWPMMASTGMPVVHQPAFPAGPANISKRRYGSPIWSILRCQSAKSEFGQRRQWILAVGVADQGQEDLAPARRPRRALCAGTAGSR